MTERWTIMPTALAITLAVAATIVAAAEAPSAICPIVKDAPAIDGVLDDAAWADSKVYGPLLVAQTGNTVAEPEMTFRTVTDGTSVFFGCVVSHPDPAELADVPVEKDAVGIFNHDTVEIFLAPDAKEAAYYHFAFGPTGSVWDTQEQQGPKDHNYPLEHATSIGADGWTLEVQIPLAELGLPEGVEQGHIMALNVCREAHGTGATDPLQAWSQTGGAFHNRGIFGELLIGTYEGAVNWRIGKLRELHGQALASAGARATDELAFWRERLTDLQQRGPEIASADGWQVFQSAARQAESEMRRLGLGSEGLFVYEVNPWELPSGTTLPDPGVEELETLTPVGLQGEWTTSAFAIANTLAEPVRVQVKTTDLLSEKMDRQVSAGEHITLCEAVEVGLLGGGLVRDALPTLDESHHVVVPSGHNGVVWATVDTRGMEPGTWIVGIKLTPLTRPELARSVRMKITVLPAEMPAGPRPYTYNWYDYDRYPSQPYPDATAKDLREHYTNVVGVQMGWPEFDEEGNVTTPIDFSEVERELARYGTEGVHYLIRRFYRWFPESMGNKADWTEAQQRNFEYYIRAVREFFESKDLTIEDFSWYVDDEPTEVDRAELVASFGKRMEQVDPEQRRWVTVYGAVTREALEMMVPWVNLWVPKFGLNEWQQELVHSRRDEGVRYFSYSVLSKSAGAYWHYRLDSWRALERGYEGFGFWNYNDVGGPNKTNWDDTDGTKSHYSVVYRGPDGPTSSARWEAHRHGAQDYRIYEWVRELARAHADTEAGKEAAAYVDGAIAEVLGNRERNTADRVVGRLRELGVAVLRETQPGFPPPAEPGATDLPVCLTANCGYLTPSVDTGGFYTYDQYPSPDHHGEACRVTEGPIYFQAEHATAAPQSENMLAGDLTDENIYYPTGYAIWFWPSEKITVTFDFGARYRLSHALMRFDPTEAQGVTAWVNVGDGEDDWRQVDANSGADPRLGWQDDLAFDLGDQVAQRVRFEVGSAREAVRLGEVRIWGRPVE